MRAVKFLSSIARRASSSAFRAPLLPPEPRERLHSPLVPRSSASALSHPHFPFGPSPPCPHQSPAVTPDPLIPGARARRGAQPCCSSRLLPPETASPLVPGCGRHSLMDKDEFLRVYGRLKEELLEDSALFKFTPESRAWMEKSLDHNVQGGKLNRGLSVVDSAAAFVSVGTPGASLSEDQKLQAAVLGWCIEWLQGYFLVMDDIMDKSVTRRGKPCWYKMPKVGLIAANDAILLNSHIFLMLKRHLSSHPKYLNFVELFNDVSYQTACGQMLDLITTPEGELDLSKYTMDTYLKIVQYKTAYYSFWLPVAAAMLLVGAWEDKTAEIAKAILVQMGTYFQAQDDFLDCFGDPAVIGKIGTDIEDSKCSWLVVTALGRATAQQKKTIEDFYGKSDPEAIATIKSVYNDLKLKEVFKEYEDHCYAELVERFKEMDPPLQAVLSDFLKKIFKRQS